MNNNANIPGAQPGPENQIDRRAANKKLLIGAAALIGIGGTAEGVRRILNSRHIEHATAQTVRELERHYAENAIRDPEAWFAMHMHELLAPEDVQRVVHCVDSGVTLAQLMPLLVQNGRLPRNVLQALQHGHIPSNVDDFSIPGPGSRHAPRPEFFARIPAGRCCGVAGHCECGACDQDDDLAASAARNFAISMNAPYLGTLHDLDRPRGFHAETGITARYTPHILNPRRIRGNVVNQDGYPQDFDFSAWGVRDRAARVAHMHLITSIVQGGHGTGSALKSGIPYAGKTLDKFRVTGILDHNSDRARIEDEIDEGFDSLPVEKVWITAPRS